MKTQLTTMVITIKTLNIVLEVKEDKKITFNGHKEVDRIAYKYSCLPHCYLLSQAYIIPTEASADEGTAGTTLICNT